MGEYYTSPYSGRMLKVEPWGKRSPFYESTWYINSPFFTPAQLSARKVGRDLQDCSGRLSRKKFVKYMMALGVKRNDSVLLANSAIKNFRSYRKALDYYLESTLCYGVTPNPKIKTRLYGFML